MIAYPLETPLKDLSPATRVYVVRFGVVYVYPASILLDIANDRYTVGSTNYPWSPRPADWEIGRALDRQIVACLDSDYYPNADGYEEELEYLAGNAWTSAGGSRDLFAIWWESVNTDAHPAWIGAAAAAAARETMTWPLFQHRYMVDDGRIYA